MAPTPITGDYYMVLEVDQTATPELVIRSYKRLALKLHPDRNAKHDATEAFQLLGRAYETLKDKSKRQAYDLIYPSVTRSRPSPQTTQTPRPPPGSTPQSGALSEAAKIAAIHKLKKERGARLRTKKNAFDCSIFELQRDIRQLEQEINSLDNIVAGEAVKEAEKNSWGTWLLSPIYKKAEDSEEEKARKDRERQETRIEKDMKERRLELKKADLKNKEGLLRKTIEEENTANRVDNKKIRRIQDRILAREFKERQKREKVERERAARILKQQQEQREKRRREAAEVLRKKQAEQRAAEQKQKEVHTWEWQKNINNNTKKYRNQYAHLNLPERFFTAEGSTRQASTSTCDHNGWWPNQQGDTACPECYMSRGYLRPCPRCKRRCVRNVKVQYERGP